MPSAAIKSLSAFVETPCALPFAYAEIEWFFTFSRKFGARLSQRAKVWARARLLVFLNITHHPLTGNLDSPQTCQAVLRIENWFELSIVVDEGHVRLVITRPLCDRVDEVAIGRYLPLDQFAFARSLPSMKRDYDASNFHIGQLKAHPRAAAQASALRWPNIAHWQTKLL